VTTPIGEERAKQWSRLCRPSPTVDLGRGRRGSDPAGRGEAGPWALAARAIGKATQEEIACCTRYGPAALSMRESRLIACVAHKEFESNSTGNTS
jgi:hypothetical protein